MRTGSGGGGGGGNGGGKIELGTTKSAVEQRTAYLHPAMSALEREALLHKMQSDLGSEYMRRLSEATAELRGSFNKDLEVEQQARP